MSIESKICKCLWDGERVLSLCEGHYKYVQKHYVQVVGTLMRVDADGNMLDYKRIPDKE